MIVLYIWEITRSPRIRSTVRTASSTARATVSWPVFMTTDGIPLCSARIQAEYPPTTASQPEARILSMVFSRSS